MICDVSVRALGPRSRTARDERNPPRLRLPTVDASLSSAVHVSIYVLCAVSCVEARPARAAAAHVAP